MKIHEYQAKAIMAEFGVPVPRGRLALTPAEAKAIAAELGGKVVIKAQVHAGGRGKGGGIKVASSPEEAEKLASQIIGMSLVTHQTGPEGKVVRKVLVEEVVDTARELYLGIIIDGAAGMPVIMASEAGGMDIEQVAATTPEKILKVYVDPATGFQPFHGRQMAFGLNLAPDQVRPAGDLIGGLYRAFIAKDSSLAEVNPMVVTPQGKLLALDAKMNFDDNALFRHKDIEALRDIDEENPLEVEAQQLGINNYIKLDGNIGCVVNGAGLAMATMDIIKLAGGEPANFLDIGTVNDPERVVGAFKLLVADPSVKAILFNIFGGMARADVIATGIVEAAKQMEIKVPVVVRLEGTNAAEGEKILAQSPIQLVRAADLGEAAEKAVASAKITA